MEVIFLFVYYNIVNIFFRQIGDKRRAELFNSGQEPDVKKTTPILTAFKHLAKQTQLKYTNLFNTTYMLAKNNRPLKDMEIQVELLEKCDVELGGKDHQNRFAARQFITSMATCIRNGI